jgi:hypothetical protein
MQQFLLLSDYILNRSECVVILGREPKGSKKTSHNRVNGGERFIPNNLRLLNVYTPR